MRTQAQAWTQADLSSLLGAAQARKALAKKVDQELMFEIV